MSINISHGALIERDLSLLEIRNLSLKMRSTFDQAVQDKLMDMLARIAAKAHDSALCGTLDFEEPLTEYSCPAGHAFEHLSKMRDDNNKGLRTWIPMSFEAVLIPIGRGKTLAMPYGDRKLTETFLKMTGARAYGYWDNSDEDENVSAKEWRQRERDWTKGLGHGMNMTPAEAGMTIQLVSTKYSKWWIPEVADMAVSMEALPELSIKSRAAQMAFDVAQRDHFRDLPPAASASLAVRASRSFEEQAKEPAMALKIAELASAIENTLAPLTEEDLRTPLKELLARGEQTFRALADRLELDKNSTSTAPITRRSPSL